MVKADGSSKEVKIDRGSAVIGREEGCRLRIPLKAVSRKHCEVKIEDDELVVADLGSSNGTFVNGKRVKQTELAPGDLLCVGPIVFVVRIDGHPRQIDAKDSFAAGAVTDADDSGEFPPVGSGAGGGAGGAPASGGAPKAPPPAAKKPAESDDEEDISDLLKGLDLGDDEDDAPPSKRGR
jgi:pSer/pThr/pTyr-binding forkhead associated (FHA) protein